MKPNKVAVCIPTFNQSGYIALAVESALAQTGVETEVWVADDASTDATDKVLARFDCNPRVHLHRHAENTGIAHNAGWVLSQPTTDFIVRLDSDDLLHPDYCRCLVGLFEDNPRAAVAHCAVRQIDAHGKSGRVRRLARRSGFQKSEEALRESAAGYKVAANVCMFRRSALISLPYIYPVGLNFAEDWDLYIRLAEAGWGNAYCSRVLASYRVWEDSDAARGRRRAAEIAGITYVFSQTLADAWRRRSWAVDELNAKRRKFAHVQSSPIAAMDPGSTECAQLLKLLSELAGDPDFSTYHAFKKCRIRSLLEGIKTRTADFLKAVLFR